MRLNELNNLLNESGIRIPKGTHAAKIIHHQDFDGVFSAIITRHQLIRQGIDPKHIITHWVQYGDKDEDYEKLLKRSKGQMVALVDYAGIPDDSDTPDFWTDHHPTKKEVKRGKSGGQTKASDFKSDSQHISYVHTTNLVDQKTIDVINVIDSAGYTNLEDVLKLPKDFKSSGRMERLGILCNALLTKSGILNNNEMLSSFIKKTQPSIVSFYNNILKYVRLNDIQDEAVRELKKQEPDWEMIEKSRKLMPTKKTRDRIQKGKVEESALSDYEELEKLKKKKRSKEEEERYKELANEPISSLRAHRLSDIKKEKSKDTTFEKRGSTLIQHKSKLQRYVWTQLNSEGLKHPFVVKRYSTFIQVAINPDLPDKIKKHIDLGAISEEVMKTIRNKFGNKYNEWAFKIIDKESGGHKGITNISGLGTLGLMKKADRTELKALEALEKRVKALHSSKKELSDKDRENLNKAKEMLHKPNLSNEDEDYYKKLEKLLSSPMRKFMPKHLERFIELKDKKKWTAKRRTEIMDEIIEEFINQFKKKFNASKDIPVMGKKRDVKLTGGKKEYEFESILNKVRHEI